MRKVNNFFDFYRILEKIAQVFWFGFRAKSSGIGVFHFHNLLTLVLRLWTFFWNARAESLETDKKPALMSVPKNFLFFDDTSHVSRALALGRAKLQGRGTAHFVVNDWELGSEHRALTKPLTTDKWQWGLRAEVELPKQTFTWHGNDRYVPTG